MTVSNYKAIGKNSLVGAFDLDTPAGFKFTGVLLMEKAGKMWISFPGIPYEKEGKKSYKPVVDIPDYDRRNAFNSAVIAALREEGCIQ